MSTQVTSGIPRKQPANVYTVMLVLSVIFLLIAVIAMIIEYRRYAPDYWKTGNARPAGVSSQSVGEVVSQMQRLG